MAAFAMTSFAQTTQQYWRVEFDMPITGNGTGTSVAAGMKDNYTYCNPEHQYLDFPANGNLTAHTPNGGKVNPMSFRSTTTNYNEFSTFYIENGRTAQYNPTTSQETYATYPYQVDHITKITTYSLPVETVSLISAEPFESYTFPGNGKTYKGCVYTFNRLPRNVAELKTLMDDPTKNNSGDRKGNRCDAAYDDPLFIAAVFYLVCPRLLDCSQDCREMMDYLFGTQYNPGMSTYGVGNATFQNWCIGSSFDQLENTYYRHYQIFQHFGGATPNNQYRPNGGDYWTGPYKVRVVYNPNTPTEHSSLYGYDITNVLLMPNPDATDKADMSFEDPTAHAVKLRSTGKYGWFMLDGEKLYFQKAKEMGNDDF